VIALLYARTFKTAGAGDNFLSVTLPSGSVLKIVNVLNNTTGWLRTTAMVCKAEGPDDDPETISLFHRAIQPAIKDVHWDGEIKLKSPYTLIRAALVDCQAGDLLALTVGYE